MNKMKCKYLSVLASVGLAVLLLLAQTNTALAAATAPSLGGAESFGVLGWSTVTNIGSSVINGNLGLWPGTSITGFPPGTVNGTIYATDAIAYHAQIDALNAYYACASQTSYTDLTNQDLGTVGILTPGVYHFDNSAQLTGTLYLDALGDANSVFIFQIGSTLTTASGSKVVVQNPPPGGFCNKYFQVGSSATLGTNTEFVGTIIALASITMNTGASLDGRALALNGAVTLDSNVVTVPVCAGSPPIPPTPLPAPTLSGWGLILLTGLLVSVGFFTLRKSGKLRLG